MVLASSKDRRTEITKHLGYEKLPKSIGTKFEWDPWTCLWAGSSHILKDYGDKDLTSLSQIMTDIIQKTYKAIIQ